MDSNPVVVNGNHVKSWSGNAEMGDPETRLVPVISTNVLTEPPINVQSSPARV